MGEPSKFERLLRGRDFYHIMHKTWYLVTVLSRNNKIMGFQLMSTRDKTQIQKLIQDCVRRLNYGLQLLVTDGFGIYKGIVLDLGFPLIHVRHIHAPPYGRVEIDTIIYHPHHVEVICATTTTDILLQTGVFLAQMEKKVKIRYGTKKRGRKAGGRNRSKSVIMREKQRKMLRKRRKNPRRTTETHVLYFDQKAL